MFKFAHNNLNVLDLEKSLKFYKDALDLTEKSRMDCGDFILVYLGDNEFHLAFTTKNFREAHERHEKMDCICYENKGMGIYFIEDPDGYWIEILPEDDDF